MYDKYIELIFNPSIILIFTNEKNINKVMRSVSNQLQSKPKITSQSFRIGYISALWRNSKDIEFVCQTIWPPKFKFNFELLGFYR